MTSAGIAATNSFLAKQNLDDSERFWRHVLAQGPAVQEQLGHAKSEQPFSRIPRLSFRSSAIAGRNWALLPSAAGFVDPLLSSGFPLTLLGIDRLSRIVERDWDSSRFATALQSYAAKSDAELLATARLIGALYVNMNDFPVFAALTLLYFAAASFAETARRLGKTHLAPSFLLYDDPRFGPACESVIKRARRHRTRQETNDLVCEIIKAIEPVNVAGLGNSACRNWYPVDPEDLLRSAAKVEASEHEILALLQRCGFYLEAKS
jgi:FADH2 O2-dependent halogenase